MLTRAPCDVENKTIAIHKVTAWHNVSASKTAIIQARISCRRSNLVKIIPEPSATLKTCSRS